MKLQLERTHYRPGQWVGGWLEHAPTPHPLELSLKWRTEGRGDPKSHTVTKTVTQTTLERTTNTFQLELPSYAPHSYDGTLFRTRWEVCARVGAHQCSTGFRVEDSPTSDPYLALNLKHNPFIAEEIPARIERWQGIAEHLWLERGFTQAPLPGQGQLVQLLGVKGAGKSSHLLKWRGVHPGPFLHYPPTLERFRFPPLAPVCYWDEADRIPALFLGVALRNAARAQHTVCVGTHRDLSTEAKRAGLRVQTLELEGFGGALLLEWAGRRIRAATLEGQVSPLELSFELSAEQAENLARGCGGSWREVGKELHIWAAEQARNNKNVTVEIAQNAPEFVQ